MRLAGFPLCKQLRTLEHAAAGVGVGGEPAVYVYGNFDVGELALEALDAGEELRASLDAVALSGPAEDESLVRSAAVANGERE